MQLDEKLGKIQKLNQVYDGSGWEPIIQQRHNSNTALLWVASKNDQHIPILPTAIPTDRLP